MDTLSLQCWVYGDDFDKISLVEISRTETVGAIKEALKEKTSKLRDVFMNDLELYFIPMPDDEHFDATLQKWTFEGKQRLNSRHILSNLDLSDSLIIVHVVPNLDMTLKCWVRGQETHRIFPVEISRTETVIQLRKAIKEEKKVDFRDIEADALVLYKACVPRLDLETLVLNHEQCLDPEHTLDQILSDVPLEGPVYIVVEAPQSKHGVQSQRRDFLKNDEGVTTSSGGKPGHFSARQDSPNQTTHCGPPHAAVAPIPITLLHSSFGQFLHDCESLEVTPQDEAFAMKLSEEMSDIYSDVSERARNVRGVFWRHDLPLMIAETKGGYVTDGVMFVKNHCYLIAACKNEVGSTGAEPYTQASLWYLDMTRDLAPKMEGSPLPCILLLLFGPYIAFAGAAWNWRPTMETLSFVLPMHHHPTDTGMRLMIARHLGAFRKAAGTLEEYYWNLSKAKDPPLPTQTQLFPYPTSFTSIQNHSRQNFRYLSQPSQEKLVFFGEITGSEGQPPICVKFVRRYSKEAHEACQSLGCAPTLHGYENLPGGWLMVVMDQFPQGTYRRLDDATGIPTKPLLERIRTTLTDFHQKGYVHGDIRSVNIMVSLSNETKFMLVDFDWAGKIGDARYPVDVNIVSVKRPEDVKGGAIIKADHDMQMLEMITTQAI